MLNVTDQQTPPAQPQPSDTIEAPPSGRPRRRFLRWTLRIAVAGIALLALAQPSRTAARTRTRLCWPSRSGTRHRRGARGRACFDCHSNLTLALVLERGAGVMARAERRHGGRSNLNFSEWNKPQEGARDAIEAISSGSMPPRYYEIQHPKSKLSASDQRRARARGDPPQLASDRRRRSS